MKIKNRKSKTFRLAAAVLIVFSSLLLGAVSAVPLADTNVKTYSGSGHLGNEDGTLLKAKYALPQGLCFDNKGNLIVFDTYNAAVKKITGQKVQTILGFTKITDEYGFIKAYYKDGKSKDALFGRPADGVYSKNGDLFIADSENNAIRLLRGNTVYTFAGGTSGYADGKKQEAKFNNPTAIAIDKNGILYVADTNNHCIRAVSPNGAVRTIAGTPKKPGYKNGNAKTAQFYEPSGIAVDENGAIYVADTGNHTIRKIENGVVTTVTGKSLQKAGWGSDYAKGGYQDGTAENAEFKFPRGLYYTNGTLFIADTGNHTVRMLTANGAVTTVVGSGEPGDKDGAPLEAMLNKPTAVAYRNGVLYIADSLNNKIKTVSLRLEVVK